MQGAREQQEAEHAVQQRLLEVDAQQQRPYVVFYPGADRPERDQRAGHVVRIRRIQVDVGFVIQCCHFFLRHLAGEFYVLQFQFHRQLFETFAKVSETRNSQFCVRIFRLDDPERAQDARDVV